MGDEINVKVLEDDMGEIPTVTSEVKCPFCQKIVVGIGDTADEAKEEADEKLEDHFHSNIC